AWRKHDVDELRRIGQITSEAQAAALRDYFARVDDLDVEVQLLEVRPRGDHRTVRFTRRDRFRDPLGRLISQETPVQKDVARSASTRDACVPTGPRRAIATRISAITSS